jgi:hypothetical protein
MGAGGNACRLVLRLILGLVLVLFSAWVCLSGDRRAVAFMGEPSCSARARFLAVRSRREECEGLLPARGGSTRRTKTDTCTRSSTGARAYARARGGIIRGDRYGR